MAPGEHLADGPDRGTGLSRAARNAAGDGSRRVAPGRRIPLSRRLRHVLRTRVSEHPALYLPFARRKYPGPSPEVIGPETELVIDGYTRSATTFAVYAFQLAQDRPVRMAHHLHAPAQLITAVRTGVPALLLIREPEGAILSQLIREPDVTLRNALDAYARFHTCLWPYRSGLVVGEFGEVTRDPGSVIRRLNRHFGTAFDEFDYTEENGRECFGLIELRPMLSTALLGFESGVVTLGECRAERDRLKGRSASAEKAVWVPSTERERLKDALRERWRGEDVRHLRVRAERVYRQFVGEAGRT
jgi:hypothetical protein